jgi:inhibitor of growth protein 4
LFDLSFSAFQPENNPLLCFSLGVQLENEQRCQQEIEDIKHGLESGSITYDPAKLKFSEEAIEEQKHCVRIADEKVALATQTYDLVSVC